MYEEVRYRNRNVVRDEEMRDGKGRTDDKLRNLKRGESPFHKLRDLNSDRRKGVIRILEINQLCAISINKREEGKVPSVSVQLSSPM